MEAPQGVQLTGTNRPRTYHKPPHPLCSSRSTAAHTRPQLHTSYGGHSGGETPGPIPNPEAKPSSADGTAPARVWESRTPPNTTPQHQGAHHTGAPLAACDERTATVSAGPNPTGDADRNGSERRSAQRSRGTPRTGGRSVDGWRELAERGRPRTAAAGQRVQDRGQAPSQRGDLNQPQSDSAQSDSPRPDLAADVNVSELDRGRLQGTVDIAEGPGGPCRQSSGHGSARVRRDPQLALAHARFARARRVGSLLFGRPRDLPLITPGNGPRR